MILFNSLNDFNLRQKLLYKRWLKELAALEGYKIGDSNYIFWDDEYLLGVNQQYLQHDTYTDIITFDYVEGKILNGDIYISTERVRENARIYQVDFENELKRVLSHGVLHLCGYKDKTDADAAQMREKENFASSRFSSQISCN